MTCFEELLLPLGKRVVGLHIHSGDVNANTIIQLIDKQEILRTNVLYIGTARSIPDLLSGQIQVEPGCFVVLGGCAASQIREGALTAKATVVEARGSAAALYNHLSEALRIRFCEQPHSAGEDPFTKFWDSVLEQRTTTDDTIRELLLRFYPAPKSFMRVMLFQFDQTPADNSPVYEELECALKAFLPDCCMGRYRDSLALLYFHEKRVLHLPLTDDDLAQLEALLERYGAHVAISHGARHYDKLRTNYLLCNRVLTLARALHLKDEGRIHQYDRYSMYCVIDLAAQRFVSVYSHSDIVYLVHPAIVELTRYDSVHHTDLRDTLYYYLINDRNLMRTAKSTFVHRNTVVNKVNKITEMTGVDFSDGGLCQRLIFSCQLIQYYERVLHLSLQL